MQLRLLGDSEILRIVEPLMDNCLDGSNEGDHAKHVRDFTGRLKHIVTPEELARQLSQHPRVLFADREFVAVFRRLDSIGVVWRQKISTSDDELMNQAVFVEHDGRILIDHCMIC